MKDFIYVDTELATSYFAQINQGAITSFLSKSETTDQSNQNKGKESTKQAKIGLDLLANVNGTYSTKQIDTYTQAFMKSNSDTVENVLHDYLIDILIDLIDVKTLNEAVDGDFILHKGKVKIYDFESSKETVTTEIVKNIFSLSGSSKETLEELKKLENKSSRNKLTPTEQQKLNEIKQELGLNGIELAEGSFNILNKLFPDTILIKVDNTISLCDENKFRFLRNHLSPLNSSTREVTVFGRILSKVSENDTELPTDSLELFSKASTLFPEIITSSLNIKKDGDYNIRPVAIYFE